MGLELGILGRYESSSHIDYVPALCTHRPSLLPIRVLRRILRIPLATVVKVV